MLSQQAIDNLTKLADYLDKVDPKLFNMFWYQNETECGTVCCALGHGPDAGIPREYHEGWITYSNRCFVNYWNFDYWQYIFSQQWVDHDNTPAGAAARIRKVIAGYEPDCYNFPWIKNASSGVNDED